MTRPAVPEVVPDRGAAGGPCPGFCSHTDCGTQRAMAGAACAYCRREIGHSTRFYRVDEQPEGSWQQDSGAWSSRLAHEECLKAAMQCSAVLGARLEAPLLAAAAIGTDPRKALRGLIDTRPELFNDPDGRAVVLFLQKVGGT